MHLQCKRLRSCIFSVGLQNLPKEIAEVERRERAVALKEIVLNDTDGSLQNARKEAERWGYHSQADIIGKVGIEL